MRILSLASPCKKSMDDGFACLDSRGSRKILILAVFFLAINTLHAQENGSDSLTFSSLNKSSLSFILDDTYLIGGVNSSGIYYSNSFRDLSYRPGFSFGLEQYFPLKGKVFLSSGFNFSQRNFSYLKNQPGIDVSNFYLDLPITAAIELPIMRDLDFRIFFGAVIAFRLNSKINGDYDAVLNQNPDAFIYESSDFHSGDFGWHFGLSAEYKRVLFRLRSYSGFVKFDNKDQGMISSFNFEVGYFLFRSMKK
ncbi:outer membrane beta-barrel protein [Algoriphagus confluentis]|uniref:Outer membrane protein beta-barrel domain-containing protein n=1 Tax=Algoriphagus confluentis TaxID=1697556 RepID=A0ABQ6PJX9_9BACT|nr:hypothetical protein Aconfl_01670 [Algoriphagus confluentis]